MGTLLFTLIFALVFASLLGGVLLRAAIAMSNKVLKPEREKREAKTPARSTQDDRNSRYESEARYESLDDQQTQDSPENVNPYAAANHSRVSNKPSDNNPYAAPATYDSPAILPPQNLKPAIPEPNYDHACGIVMIQGLIYALINLAVATLAPIEFAPLLSIGLGFAVSIFVNVLMLPTTLGKAVVICFFQILIAIGIAITLGITFTIIAIIFG